MKEYHTAAGRTHPLLPARGTSIGMLDWDS